MEKERNNPDELPSGGIWRRMWVWGAALLAAAAPWVVLPEAGDAFELPKRLVWGALGVWLALGTWSGGRCGGSRGMRVAWWGLMIWVTARSFPRAGLSWWTVPWMAWAMPGAMFGFAAANRWEKREMRLVARAVAVSGVVQAGLMLCQRWGVDPLWGVATAGLEYAPGRMVGTVGYQNQAAEFLGLAAVCAAYGWKGWWRGGICGGLLVVLLLTANRGSMAGAAVAGLAVAAILGRLRCRRDWGAVVAVAGVALMVVAAMPELRLRTVELVRPGRSAAVGSRVWMARVAGAMWRERPFAGCGGGAYGREYLDRLGSVLPERKEQAQLQSLVYAREAHCDILQFGAEFGLAGVALLAALVWLAARAVQGTGREERSATAGVAAFMAVTSLVSFTWQTTLAGPLAGGLLGMWCCGEAREGARISRWHSAALTALALVLLGMACLENARSVGVSWFGPKGVGLAENATWLFEEGKPVEAVEAFKRAEADGVSPAILRNHGAALCALGRWDEACAVYGRWVRCGIEHDTALLNLSIAHEQAGRFAAAAAAEEERLRLFSSLVTGNHFFRLVVMHLKAGEAREALAVAERFRRHCEGRKSEWWTPDWDNLMGSAFAAAGDGERARAWWERALDRSPGMESARRNLEALQRQGSSGGAPPGRERANAGLAGDSAGVD